MDKIKSTLIELGYELKPLNIEGCDKSYSIKVEGAPISFFVAKAALKTRNAIFFGWILNKGVYCVVDGIKVPLNQDMRIAESIVNDKIDVWINKSCYDYTKFKQKVVPLNQFYVTLSELFFGRGEINSIHLVAIRDYLKKQVHKSSDRRNNTALYHLYTASVNVPLVNTESIYRYMFNVYIKDRFYKWRYISPDLKRLQESVRREYEKYRASLPATAEEKDIYRIPESEAVSLGAEISIGAVFETDGMHFKIKALKDGFVYIEETEPLIDIHTLRGEAKPTVLGFAEKDNRKAIRIAVEQLLKRYYGYIPYYQVRRNAFAMKIELRTGEYLMLSTKAVAQYANNILWDY